MRDSVDATLIHFLLYAAERIGLAREELLDDEMVAALAAGDVDRRLPYDWLHRLWTRMIALRPDAPLGVQVAQAVHPTRLGAFGYLVWNSPTVGEALARGVRFQHISDPRSTWSVIDDGAHVRLSLRADAWVSELAHPAETLIGSLVAKARLLHPEARATSIELSHAPHRCAENLEAMRAFCACQVRWNGRQTAVTFERDVLALRLPTADGRLGEILEQHACAILATLPKALPSLTERVRELVRGRLSEASIDVEGIARALAHSRRTLQRRLGEEGASFAGIVDQVRRERALALIDDARVPMIEIAFLAGFADARAFARAFRRWTGESPTAYRQSRARGR